MCAIFLFTPTIRISFMYCSNMAGYCLSRDRGKTWYDRSVGIDYVDMHYIENFPGSKERYYRLVSARFFPHRQRWRTLAARRDRHALGLHGSR